MTCASENVAVVRASVIFTTPVRAKLSVGATPIVDLADLVQIPCILDTQGAG